MELILWRHAEAQPAGPGGDLARQLSRKGRAQAERMAGWLAPRLEGDWRVLVSPASRAVQTVEPLSLRFEVRHALAPEAEAASVLRECGWPDGADTVIVGHQPTLGEVAAYLLGGGDGDVAFRKGAIWWFATRDRDGRRETILRAVVDPDLLAGP